jgi:ABC-type Fe3+ transport system substrate-binding protein
LPSTIYTDFVTPVVAASLNDFNTATYVTVPANTTAILAETAARIAADNLLAPLASPTLTGVPAAPTAAGGTSTTQLATTAFVSSQDLGVAQTWQNLTASRVFGATYTNSTTKPIFVMVGPSITANLTVTISGGVGAAMPYNTSFIVPPGGIYSVTSSAGTVFAWNELR